MIITFEVYMKRFQILLFLYSLHLYFLMEPHELPCPSLGRRMVDRQVGWLICHNFLKRQDILLSNRGIWSRSPLAPGFFAKGRIRNPSWQKVILGARINQSQPPRRQQYKLQSKTCLEMDSWACFLIYRHYFFLFIGVYHHIQQELFNCNWSRSCVKSGRLGNVKKVVALGSTYHKGGATSTYFLMFLLLFDPEAFKTCKKHSKFFNLFVLSYLRVIKDRLSI